MSLQGTLKTLGVTEVLEFLAARSASGHLEVTTEMGTATYQVVDGEVAAAEYSFIRESGTDAAEATYYVVSELDGAFYFDDDTVPEVDDDGREDVGSVLFRTAEIAERWADVEEVIPSPNHLLTRNNQLDGSVTIQPEWWKALEMIGDGSTSLELASSLQLSALDASLTALAMTNAGLLNVSEVDPLDISLDPEPGGEAAAQLTPLSAPEPDIDPAAVLSDAVEALDDLVPAPQPDQSSGADSVEEIESLRAEMFAGAEEEEPVPEIDEADLAGVVGSPFEPVDMLEMVDVEPPTPMTHAPDPAAHADAFVEPVAEQPAATEATMSFATPVEEFVAPAPVPDEPVDEFAGVSGMDDLSELEYMLEPDGVAAAPSASVSPAPDVPQLETDDDGWSSAHAGSSADLRPMSAPPAVPQSCARTRNSRAVDGGDPAVTIRRDSHA